MRAVTGHRSCPTILATTCTGIWNPEWVPATVVVYGDDWPVDSPEPRGKKPEFSVIFSDEDQAFRHIIDYDRVRVDVYRPPSQVDKLRNLYPA